MLVPLQKALLAGALLAASLWPAPAGAADVYKNSLDPSIPHHAAILDTLAKIEKTPGDAQLHNDLGCLVAWDGFWRDALRSFQKAAELAPKDSRPLFNAGLVEGLRGEWGRARSRFHKAVKVDPGNWPAWWMLGFAEESLGHANAAVDAYKRSVRVDTSLFDPRSNPFAVATRLKSRVLLETYERRRVDAALPFSNQLANPSRVASFFQAHAKAPAAPPAEEAAKSGPIVTQVPPAGTPRPATASPATTAAPEPAGRRRRVYGGARPGGAEREGPAEVTPQPPRDAAPEPEKEPPPGPGFGEGSGAPGTGRSPAPAGGGTGATPGFGGSRVPSPAPTPTPEPE